MHTYQLQRFVMVSHVATVLLEHFRYCSMRLYNCLSCWNVPLTDLLLMNLCNADFCVPTSNTLVWALLATNRL